MTAIQPRPARGSIVGSAAVVEGGLALVAVVLGWLFGIPPLASVAWTARGGLIGVAAAVPLFVGLVLANRYPLGPLAGLDEIAGKTLVPLFRSCTLFDLALICALAGLGEELLFRGILQVGLERFSGSPWGALVVAGVIFGLAHPISRTYVVVAALIGVYFGWLFLATGNLLVPVVAHAAYDLAALVYLLAGNDEQRPLAPEPIGDGWSI